MIIEQVIVVAYLFTCSLPAPVLQSTLRNTVRRKKKKYVKWISFKSAAVSFISMVGIE